MICPCCGNDLKYDEACEVCFQLAEIVEEYYHPDDISDLQYDGKIEYL